MRRRWIAALVLATSLVFLIAGTALGYWVIPEGKGAADCEAAINYYEVLFEQDWSDSFVTDAGLQMVDDCHPGGQPD